ncbi:MAG TPA: hypothetical protein VMV69_10395 [Pirellulales bacterium]|nr:hypothetical protein [Pirellulales bacterium]
MTQLVLAIALGFFALPPHDFDNVLKNKKVPPKDAQKKILDSKEFKAVVDDAVAASEGAGAKYSQFIRHSIGKQLSVNPDDVEPPAEDDHHPLDKDIKNGAKTADIIAAFKKSKAFADVIKKAVEESEELPKGSAGATFGQSVRVKISDDLLNIPPEPKDDGEGN